MVKQLQICNSKQSMHNDKNVGSNNIPSQYKKNIQNKVLPFSQYIARI